MREDVEDDEDDDEYKEKKTISSVQVAVVKI